MASFSLYDTTITPMIRSLHALSAILKKGEEYADEKSIPHSELLEARLAPDMLDFIKQIQILSNTAKFLCVRAAGIENVVMEDNEKTFEDLQARIAKTIDFLQSVKQEDFKGIEEKEVIFREHKFTSVTYATTFAMPNFYFHTTVAYSLLRMKGVTLGKLDYLGKA